MNIVSVIDIGTNSIRLGVYRVDAHTQTPLALHKEAVRLGQSEFAHNRITKASIERGLSVMREFAEIARRNGSSEIVTVATAAVREAQNRDEFVKRAKKECGLDVKVVSGLEEARLIYLGAVSGVELDSRRALFVDIGGGSTELVVGDAREPVFLDSVKLGAVRLTDMFLRGRSGPVDRKTYTTLVDYARGVAGRTFRQARDAGFDQAIGSSGTIMNLAEITAKRKQIELASIRGYRLTAKDLEATAALICELDLKQRRSIPGINPERADIIVSGAAILEAIMAGTGVSEIVVTDRALRDGVLIDYLFKKDAAGKDKFLSMSPRRRSVVSLCKSCRIDENHAAKTASLADSIYRQLRDQRLHPYGEAERELLEYSSMLHDVGTFISSGDHHKHSYYIIRNSNLLGFSDEEIETIAIIAMCHRKAPPRKAAPRRLDNALLRRIDVLASILRIADALDRSQLGLVREVVCAYDASKNQVLLDVYAQEDCPLEILWLENKKQLFEATFGVSLSARVFVDN